MKQYIFVFLLLGISLSAFAQEKYWILFEDKGDLSALCPEDLLSPKAFAQRKLKNIPLEPSDYPVSEAYIQCVKEFDIIPVRTSKWMNGVSAILSDDQIQLLKQEPWIRDIRPVLKGKVSKTTSVDQVSDDDINSFQWQLQMLDLDLMHANGYTGSGITIAIFDNGFRNADSIGGFEHIYNENRVLATYDFVDNDPDVYEDCPGSGCKHGTWVWSIIAGIVPNQLTGAAYDANFILLRTENDYSETHQEEDNWVAAAEFADSLGADIFTTSLGYNTFDPGEGNYSIFDMDGSTAIITNASDMAAEKGITVINSNGNEGNGGIIAPADGDYVIAVGAVNNAMEYSTFSSVGPTADGRIKPDVSAMGERTFLMETNGAVGQGNGTSFSAPLIAGYMACLMQAVPGLDRQVYHDALIRSAHQYTSPDNFLGYGIPNISTSYELLTSLQLPQPISDSLLAIQQVIPFPNPNNGDFTLAIQSYVHQDDITIELMDNAGRRMLYAEETLNLGYNALSISGTEQSFRFPPGIYHLRVWNLRKESVMYSGKIMVIN